MEEPPECLTDSVDLGPEGSSVRGEGFEPCPSFKLVVREYTLELSDSVSNLSLHFSVVWFRQFSVLPGEVSFYLGFSVIDTRQLCQVVCQLISYSRHCLFEPGQLSSGLGDPHVSIGWLSIVVRVLSTCSALWRALSAMPGRSSSSMLSRLLGRVLSACWSAFTAELLRPFHV